MFNIGSGEIVFIAVAALLILGPKRLPELARGIGKFMREFRRQTDDVRHVVEREFYKMDEELEAPLQIKPADGARANSVLPIPEAHTLNALPSAPQEGDLPLPPPSPSHAVASQLTAGTPAVPSSADPTPVTATPEPISGNEKP